MTARSYRELDVWRVGMDLAEQTYRLTRLFPRAEEYRLTSQLVRAAASVVANVAEGNARATRRDYARHVAIARGSLAETETFLLLARRLEMAPLDAIDPVLALADRVGRMLTSLHRSLDAPSP